MLKKFIKIYIIANLIMQSVWAQLPTTTIIEENREFWNTLIQNITISNKNLLYAGYIAYKDKLYDLSIESFQECLDQNTDNQVIQGIANYYIGKNLYYMGEYKKALLYFLATERHTMDQYTYIKAAALINASICYMQINDTVMAKTYLQKSMEYDIEGIYKTTIETLMQSLKDN
ncbi:MAG: tetratricopeptide repeat protein [Spirochaetota bacterium]